MYLAFEFRMLNQRLNIDINTFMLCTRVIKAVLGTSSPASYI